MNMERRIAGLSKALMVAGNEHTVGDVIREVLHGDAQSWDNGDAWIITRIVDAPQVRSIHFWLATGEKAACVELAEQVIDWARSVGCTRATMLGRAGWTRVLEDSGWKPSKLVVLEREI